MSNRAVTVLQWVLVAVPIVIILTLGVIAVWFLINPTNPIYGLQLDTI